MAFTSAEFLVFLAITAVLFHFSPARFRAGILVAASYAFYCTWSIPMAAILLLITAAVYLAARRLETTEAVDHTPILLIAIVSALVAYLGSFKLAEAFGAKGSLLIPLGISYYTFKLISYVVDVHWKKIAAERSFARFAAFVVFFPQIMAGPIQRGDSFLPQVKLPRTPGSQALLMGVARILIGFTKKFLVADNLAVFANYGFAHPHGRGGGANVLAGLLFPLQLYADFGGLTDIAIGAALLFGIQSPENFDRPFLSDNIGQLWRRWHMSLTYWLRDYVFTPLRMAVRNWGDWGLAFSITANMILIGLWHGLTATFFVFGVVNSIYMVVDALTAQQRKRFYKKHPRTSTIMAWTGPWITYLLFAIACVFFRAATLGQAFAVLGGIFRPLDIKLVWGSILSPPHSNAWLGLPAFAFVELLDWARRRFATIEVATLGRPVRWSLYVTALVTSVFLLLVLLTRQTEPNPFLYAMF
jgi:alginate O-acetyltransferase complex protein AlgI